MSEMDLTPDLAAEDLAEPAEESELDLEAPEADAAEQRAPLTPPEGEAPRPAPLDADPADVAEQERVVELDEDDYR